jgi:hypothetical protein
MTQLLELAIDAARQLSPEEQDELARTILEIVHGTGEDVYVLSDEENAAIDVALAQLERGEFFTKEDVAAVFSKYREK